MFFSERSVLVQVMKRRIYRGVKLTTDKVDEGWEMVSRQVIPIHTYNNGWDHTTRDIVNGTAPIPHTDAELLSIAYTGKLDSSFDIGSITKEDGSVMEMIPFYKEYGVPMYRITNPIPDQMDKWVDLVPPAFTENYYYKAMMNAVMVGRISQSRDWLTWVKSVQDAFLRNFKKISNNPVHIENGLKSQAGLVVSIKQYFLQNFDNRYRETDPFYKALMEIDDQINNHF